MNLKWSFSWIGLVVFALPMLINIVYAVFPPVGDASPSAKVTRWVEIVEQVSRIAYLLAVTFLVSREPVNVRSIWLYLAALFLLLYYAVWIRYFCQWAGGRAPAPRLSLRADAAGSVSRPVLFVCRRLATE